MMLIFMMLIFILLFVYFCYWIFNSNVSLCPEGTTRETLPIKLKQKENKDIWATSYQTLIYLYGQIDNDSVDVDLLFKTLDDFVKNNPHKSYFDLVAIWLFSVDAKIVAYVQNLIVQALQDLPVKEKIDVLRRILAELNLSYKTTEQFTTTGECIYMLEDSFFNPQGLDNLLKTIIAVFKLRGLNYLATELERDKNLIDLIAKYRNAAIEKKDLFLLANFVTYVAELKG